MWLKSGVFLVCFLLFSFVVYADFVSGVLVCSDSDGGDVSSRFGSITVSDPAREYFSSLSDACFDDASVVEYFCVNSDDDRVGSSEKGVEYDTGDEYAGASIVFSSDVILCDGGCVEGVCVTLTSEHSSDPCVGVICDPVDPFCDGNTRISANSYCSGGECFVETFEDTCSGVCRDGVCRDVLLDSIPLPGLSVDQIDFSLEGYKAENSNWGRLHIVHDEFFGSSFFIGQGYLNMYTDNGWVVKNLYVQSFSEQSSSTTYFDFGNRKASNIQTLSARIVFDEEPQRTFSDGERQVFAVGDKVWNAEGYSAPPHNFDERSQPVLDMDPLDDNDDVVLEGPTYSHTLPNVSNVETAKSQCGPMSVANSLQYLEDAEGIEVPHPHEQGLKGDDTLVGELDRKMRREVTSRRSGKGIGVRKMMSGKFGYLKENGLENALINKHQGVGKDEIPSEDFSSSGMTSTSHGAKVTFEWVCNEIKDGEDVELFYLRYNATGSVVGGHAVRAFGCGETLGVPWIRYAHDRNQGNDTEGLETPTVIITDSDNDGTLNFGSESREIVFAHAESPREEVAILSTPSTDILSFMGWKIRVV